MIPGETIEVRSVYDGRVRWAFPWQVVEDDFAEARVLGAFDDAKAASIRAEGERVIAAKPWPTGWEDWRP